jgi:hypothetical protein
MGEGQIPYAGVEEDLEKAKLTKEQKEELAANPELTVADFYPPETEKEIPPENQETPHETYLRKKHELPQLEYDRNEIGERPDDVPVHVKQKLPKEYSDNYIPKELQKEELPQYRYGKIRVYLVNGDYIRTRYANESIGDRLGNDWAGGGHYFVFWKIVPKNEIWIDRTLVGLDRKGYILHEMTERRIMEMGGEYSDTHNDYANPPEIVARQTPHAVDRMIQDEMTRYEKPVKIKKGKLPKPPSVAEIEKKYERYAVSKTQIEDNSNEDDEIAPKYYLGRKIVARVESS